ncbi:26S proteasome regulatory subunit RPN1 [Dictyocoela muelleri]|nr:26S proteasome regulatory subunit RPN1 [Dictyocoela muelleri]
MDYEDKYELILQNLKTPDLQESSLNMIIEMIRGPDNTLNFHRWMENKKILEEIYNSIQVDNDNKKLLSDILSVLYVCSNGTESLSYRLKGGVLDLDCWGIAYIRKICNDILDVYCLKMNAKNNYTHYKNISLVDQNVLKLCRECVKFLVDHNSECDAIDFLVEIGKVEEIVNYVKTHNYKRIVLYLEGLSKFINMMEVLLAVHRLMNNQIDFLLCLINLNRIDEALAEYKKLTGGMKKQAAFIMAKFNIFVEDEELKDIFLNNYLSPFFVHIRADMEIDTFQNMECEIKTLIPSIEVDTKTSQYTSIGTGLINYGSENQVIFSEKSDRSEFVAIFAANGLLSAFNSEKCLEKLNNLIFGTEIYKKTGSLLAYAISCSQVIDLNQTALALLAENLDTKCVFAKAATILGIQLIYSGTKNKKDREAVKDILIECADSESIEICGMACFALGSIFVGTGDLKLVDMMLNTLNDHVTEFGSAFYKLISLGLALLFFKNKNIDTVISTLKGFKNSAAKYTEILIQGMSLVESGNTDFIEKLIGTVFAINPIESESEDLPIEIKGNIENPNDTEHLNETKKDVGNLTEIENLTKDKKKCKTDSSNEDLEYELNPDLNLSDFMAMSKEIDLNDLKNFESEFEIEEYETKSIEAISLLSITLISLCSGNTRKMCARLINAAACTESDEIKSVIPLCMALLYSSNPNVEIIDTLVKNLNSSNLDVVIKTILSLGIIGAGTNNSKIIDVLINHMKYQNRCPKSSIAVTMAISLIKLGKGTLSLNPYSYKILNPKLFIGLFSTILLMMDDNILFNYPFLWYSLSAAINSKVLIAVDENLNPVNVDVKVGSPVEIVGLAGEQKKLSGVQVFQSPAVIGVSEEAEIDDDCFMDRFEGVVVMK